MVIVVGLGITGSSTLYHLAKRGIPAIGIDRFAPGHILGSSHGKSRIIREAYFEDPRYVPLVQRAYQGWAALERDGNVTLFHRTGGLMLGPSDGELVRGARLSAERHGLPHEVLSAAEVRARFPAFVAPEDMIGVWEPRAGALAPERAIETFQRLAVANGATLRFNERVVSWAPSAHGVDVLTDNGMHAADRVILCAGPWMHELIPSFALPLTVERNAVLWFKPERDAPMFAPDRFPIFICESPRERMWYGFPDLGDGVKVALHHQGAACHPDAVDRTVSFDDVERVRTCMRDVLPAANGPLVDSTVCLYTNTPDDHFVLGAHPETEAAIVASPCSGHGFKFAPVIGEALADLVMGKLPAIDISAFDPARFRRAAPSA